MSSPTVVLLRPKKDMRLHLEFGREVRYATLIEVNTTGRPKRSRFQNNSTQARSGTG